MYLVKDMDTALGVPMWLRQNTDWQTAINDVGPPKRTYDNDVIFDVENFDVSGILDSVTEALKVYGEHKWRYTQHFSDVYSGFALMYNPRIIDSDRDIHAASLGSATEPVQNIITKNIQETKELQNSYFDAFGFIKPTPASETGALGAFLKRGKIQPIRSRLAILDGNKYTMRNRTRGWHTDEPIFENLRINVPLQTSEEFKFQTKGFEPINLDVGKAYTWDTSLSHRVFIDRRTDKRRIHLVLGYSPWWNYDAEQDGWYKNEFFGKKHPFDMLADGDVFEGLRLT